MITPDQIRAARKALGWTAEKLAGEAGLSRGFVSGTENGKMRSRSLDALQKLQSALEAGGIEFTNEGEPGLRLRGPSH